MKKKAVRAARRTKRISGSFNESMRQK